MTDNHTSPPLARQWLLTLLLGSTIFAAHQGLVHFSDWCYLATATVMAAGISALMIPLNCRLLQFLAEHGPALSSVGRWTLLLGGTGSLFALANLLTLPLLTWLGPGSTWPWGVAALLVVLVVQWPLL